MNRKDKGIIKIGDVEVARGTINFKPEKKNLENTLNGRKNGKSRCQLIMTVKAMPIRRKDMMLLLGAWKGMPWWYKVYINIIDIPRIIKIEAMKIGWRLKRWKR